MFDADLGKIGATVTLNDKPFVDTINNVKKKADATFSMIAKSAAGLFGLNQLRSFVQSSVEAFIKQENAVNGLNRALNRVGEGRASKRLQDFAKEMQSVTTYGDEATISVMKMGINMGLSSKQMEEATRAAMGLAAGYDQLNLESAMQLVAKAANGNTARLKMFGITLSETGTKQEKFNELLKKGNDLFQLAHADTFGQRLTQLGNAWGDLKEQIGDFFLQLTGFYDSVDDMKAQIEDFTKRFAENLDYWAYYVRYFTAMVKSGVKVIIAAVEPVFNYVVDLGKDAGQNLLSIMIWIGENWEKIWSNFPDIGNGVLKDILNMFKNFAETILDLATNLGKAFWQAIKGEGIGGFREVWNKLIEDAAHTFAEVGSETQAAMNRAGVTSLPELQQTASLKKVIEGYEKLPEKIDEISRGLELDINRASEGMTNNLNRKRGVNYGTGTGRDPVEEASKSNVAGSFSAAVLAGMLGANRPEKETAKNTRQMVEQQKETNQKLADYGPAYT